MLNHPPTQKVEEEESEVDLDFCPQLQRNLVKGNCQTWQQSVERLIEYVNVSN
jgi:hypothetical protein